MSAHPTPCVCEDCFARKAGPFGDDPVEAENGDDRYESTELYRDDDRHETEQHWPKYDDEPEPPPHPADVAARANGPAAERAPTSWAPVDLAAALAGEDVEPPVLWERTDGVRLIYAGRVHWFQGESESCKSWAAQRITADELGAGRDVLYIDFEDDDRGIVARLRALGATDADIARHLTYLRPDEPLCDRHGAHTDGTLDLLAVIGSRSFSVAVIDGVTEAMASEGLDPMLNTDIALWMRRLPRRLSNGGPAVVCLDHVPKASDAPSRYAIGGQHKLAGLSGAAYRFTPVRPLGRALASDPVEGIVAITVEKDRPGWVRGKVTERRVGTFELTAWPDGGVTTRLVPPSEHLTADRIVCRRVLVYLADYDGSSQRAVRDNVEGDTSAIVSALRWMADPVPGWLRIEKSGRSFLHYLTDAGRAQLDAE